MVTIAIPLWISRRYGIEWMAPQTALEIACFAAAIALFLAGLALFASTLYLFATRGRGTLAPWDPPAHLVVRGPYRFVRNPMISGVILVLVAESLLLRSQPHAQWALAFLIINAIYIPLLEEPMLEARFGDEYRDYKRHIPRLVPRLRAWVTPRG